MLDLVFREVTFRNSSVTAARRVAFEGALACVRAYMYSNVARIRIQEAAPVNYNVQCNGVRG